MFYSPWPGPLGAMARPPSQGGQGTHTARSLHPPSAMAQSVRRAGVIALGSAGDWSVFMKASGLACVSGGGQNGTGVQYDSAATFLINRTPSPFCPPLAAASQLGR